MSYLLIALFSLSALVCFSVVIVVPVVCLLDTCVALGVVWFCFAVICC